MADGATAIPVRVLVNPVTLSVADAEIPLREAVTVVAPDSVAVTIPLALILPTPGVPELHTTEELISAVVLSLYFPVAANCWVAPTSTLAEEGVIEMEER